MSNIPHPMRYVPDVFCNKCRRSVDLITREAKSGKQATLVAHCHGARQEVSFVEQPKTQVDAFHTADHL